MTIDILAFKLRERKGLKPALPEELVKEQQELEAILSRLQNGVPSSEQTPETEQNQTTAQTSA